jgi:hypothetical protein
MSKQQENSRLYRLLKSRFDLLGGGSKTSYERTLMTGNLKGVYTKNEEGIDIEIYSIKSELLVYKLLASKDRGGIFVESIPYYRGMVHNLYYAGVYDERTDNQELLLGILDSIRTDEQKEFLLTLLLGGSRGQSLVNALGKVIEYLESFRYYDSTLTDFEIFSNYLRDGYKYSFDVTNIDEGWGLEISLNVYEGVCNKECAYVLIDYTGSKTTKSLRVSSYNYETGIRERFTLEGFEESKIQICVTNLLELQGVKEEEFVKLLERAGFKL